MCLVVLQSVVQWICNGYAGLHAACRSSRQFHTISTHRHTPHDACGCVQLTLALNAYPCCACCQLGTASNLLVRRASITHWADRTQLCCTQRRRLLQMAAALSRFCCSVLLQFIAALGVPCAFVLDASCGIIFATRARHRQLSIPPACHISINHAKGLQKCRQRKRHASLTVAMFHLWLQQSPCQATRVPAAHTVCEAG